MEEDRLTGLVHHGCEPEEVGQETNQEETQEGQEESAGVATLTDSPLLHEA